MAWKPHFRGDVRAYPLATSRRLSRHRDGPDASGQVCMHHVCQCAFNWPAIVVAIQRPQSKPPPTCCFWQLVAGSLWQRGSLVACLADAVPTNGGPTSPFTCARLPGQLCEACGKGGPNGATHRLRLFGDPYDAFTVNNR
jgi:hypothetical protein